MLGILQCIFHFHECTIRFYVVRYSANDLFIILLKNDRYEQFIYMELHVYKKLLRSETKATFYNVSIYLFIMPHTRSFSCVMRAFPKT